MEKTAIAELYHADCFDAFPSIPDKSVDAIICDLPYGTTACKWDIVIPFEPLWEQYKRIIKPNGAIILFGSQPFTSALIMSNPKWFKYELIWEKDKPSDFALASRRTMKYHENIIVFCDGRETYNPQMTIGAPNHSVGKGVRKKRNESGANTAVVTNKTDGLKHPKSVMKFNREPNPQHPTQKPVALLEYLVKTYTNEGDIVVDNAFGSCTTGLACLKTNRRFIGMEKERQYFDVGVKRLQEYYNLPNKK